MSLKNQMLGQESEISVLLISSITHLKNKKGASYEDNRKNKI